MKLLLISTFIFSSTILLAQDLKKPQIIDSLESKFDDISPVISPDGETLYFTKAKHPENSGGESDPGDIWQSKKVDGKWSRAVKMKGPVNNAFYNAVIGITADGNIMYVVGNYDSPRKGGVSFSRRISDSWSEPKAVDIPYFKNKSDHLSGSLSPDGKIMVLSLESFGTTGNEDIYYTFRKTIDQWTELRNLGEDINTSAQEYSPYLAGDNKTLFYSSNGLGGAGSRDVFYSTRQDATWTSWSEPVNLSIINSEGADWYFKLIEGTDEALLVNTLNSTGLGNLLMVNKPEEIGELEAAVVEKVVVETKPVIPYKSNKNDSLDRTKIEISFNIIDGLTGKQLTPQIIVKGVNEMKKSSFSEIILSAGSSYKTSLFKDSTYKVGIDAEGYLNETRNIKTDTIENNDVIVLELVKLEKGTTIQLQSVLFKRGTSEMQESSFEELDRVVSMLKKNEKVEIELSGHTDNTGSSKLNIKLSQERADVIKEYLVGKGIDDSRLKSKGYGGARPIASNKSEATRKLNRRVEFTITKN